MIDPKKLELSAYRALEKYHLITSEDLDEYIITRADNAIVALRSVEAEMERRYEILAGATVRNIAEYNQKIKNGEHDKEFLPYIVVVVDELADLMMTSAKEVEEPITRLAQMSRAVGIHLIIATQRPSVDVITGIIKANFPARIAFQVTSKVDSRTILDINGAEKLLGRGDMLITTPQNPEPVRLHSAYITLDELEKILAHIQKQPKPGELELPSVQEEKSDEFNGLLNGERDPLYYEALRLVVTHQQGSISLLQRRLRVGYSRAARLIDELEAAGIVGPFTGSKAREVLVDENYLEDLDEGRYGE
jgi:S-DNA-T family DNA segregation ATPase FtsK/SpoIIIE